MTHMSDIELTEMLTPDQVCEYLHTPRRTVDRWRAQRVGPPAVTLGKQIWYPKDELVAWFKKQTAEWGQP